MGNEEREHHKARGRAESGAQGMCSTCYKISFRAQTRAANYAPRREGVPVEDVADIFSMFSTSLTRGERYRRTADRLNMKVETAERAVQRARRLGLCS